MPHLIDGYNLLHVTGLFGKGAGRTPLARSRNALLDFLVAALDPAEIKSSTIVFDAREAPPRLPRQLTHAGLNVQFAEKHETADELLETLIAAATSPRRLIVVSSDHRVQRAAKRRKATAIDSDRWYIELIRHKRETSQSQSAPAEVDTANRPVSPAEVQAWIRAFGLDPLPADMLETSESDTPSAARQPRRKTPPAAIHPPQETKPAARKKSPRKKTSDSPTRATHKKPASSRPPHLASGDLRNPFPPGYGEDLLDDSDRELR